MAYDFVLFAAGLAGLGRHLWNVRAIEYPKLAQVNQQRYCHSLTNPRRLHSDFL